MSPTSQAGGTETWLPTLWAPRWNGDEEQSGSALFVNESIGRGSNVCLCFQGARVRIDRSSGEVDRDGARVEEGPVREGRGGCKNVL